MAQMVDRTALKFNQASIIVLLAVAFLFNWAWLVAFVAAVMLIGTLWPQAGLFKLIYQRLLKPAGWLKPDLVADEIQPHLFAQGIGGLFLTAAIVPLMGGASAIGWLLVGVVAVLAAVNLFFGFCLGCFIYYQLARLGLRPNLPMWQTGGSDQRRET